MPRLKFTSGRLRWSQVASWIVLAGGALGCSAVGLGTPLRDGTPTRDGNGVATPAATNQAVPSHQVAAPAEKNGPAPVAAKEPAVEPELIVSDTPPEAAADTTTAPPGEPRLYAPVGMVKIRELPDRDAPVIGGFRAGQSVLMTDTTMTPLRKLKRMYQCDEGWYPVAPRGFVCVGGGPHATRDANDPRVLAARAVLPDTSAAYPFHFGVSVGAPQYLRVPTEAEQRTTEPDLNAHLAQLPAADDEKGGAVDATPAGRGPSDAWLKYQAHAKPKLVHDQAVYDGYKIAWSQQFDANGRTWLVTPDMTLIPKDKVRQKPLPTLQGIDLSKNTDVQFPIAYFWLGDSHKYVEGADGKLVKTQDSWKRQSFVEGTMNQKMGPGGIYWQLKSGEYVKYQDITMIRKGLRPSGVAADEKWIEARVTWGYLIAYVGDEPAYVTAMSPGIDGINKRAHATAMGKHFVDWKMITEDMSGRDKGKDWFVEEVPWVAYYKDGFALHGAWWHDDFGRPKSHGCVNLAPADARFLFRWMDPVIPKDWYAASSHYPYSKGTFVYIRH
jgi:hypothetical protein